MTMQIFLSYAHADDEQVAQVGDLVSLLRAAGLDVTWDGEVKTPQGPPEGWPAWMLDRIDDADWVLVLCDEAYYRRFRRTEEPGKGLGVRWEGAIINQALYREDNRKFVPVLLEGASIDAIPEPLRGATFYRLPDDAPNLVGKLTPNAHQPILPRKRRLRSPAARYTYLLLLLLIAALSLIELARTRDTANFALTVYVQGTTGRQNLPLRNHGAVLLDLGRDRRRERIGENGEARFTEIPASFRGLDVNLALDDSDYELVNSRPRRIDATSLYVEVRRKPARITGTVLDEQGKPIAGATVSVAGISARTTSTGLFVLTLPSEAVADDLTLQIDAAGYQTWRHALVLNGGPTMAVLGMER